MKKLIDAFIVKKQLQQIIKAFNHLLFTWNLSVDIPKKVPLAKTYSLLISTLDEKTDIVNSGFMTFEFCNYDRPSCPFGVYCICEDFDVDDNMDIDLPKGDLPFLASFDLATKKSETIWRCQDGVYEQVVDVLDADNLQLLTRKESQKDVPNYF